MYSHLRPELFDADLCSDGSSGTACPDATAASDVGACGYLAQGAICYAGGMSMRHGLCTFCARVSHVCVSANYPCQADSAV